MPRIDEMIALIDSLDKDVSPAAKHELFNCIRRWWDELGEDTTIADRVCAKLDMTKPMFSMYLNNPGLVYGLETLHRNVKPGWLRTYLDYTSGHEAPEDFHIWVGLTVLSSVVRRKVWFDNHFYRLYPNLYTILVSPPGVGKKTTAINIGIELLRAASSDCRIINEKVTPEALVDVLSKPTEKRTASGGVKAEVESQALLVAPELTVFLGREQYNEGLIILLTRLYDCPNTFDTSTVSRGTKKLENLWASLLGATTPSEISKAIPASATGGGFTSRIHLIQRESSPRFFPFAIPNDPLVREALINQLRAIDSASGPFTFSDGANKWYTDYYRIHKEGFEKGMLQGANAERQPDHIVKLAMLMSLAEGAGMEFSEDMLQRAFNILYASMQGTKEVLRMIDSSERGKAAQITLDAIKQLGGVVDRSRLTRKLYRKLDGRELNMALDTLVDGNLITKFRKEGKAMWYKIVTFDDRGDD